MKKIFLLIIFHLISQSVLYAQSSPYIVKIKKISYDNKSIEVLQVYLVKETDTIDLEEVNKIIMNRFDLYSDAPKDEKDYEEFVSALDFFENFSGYLDIKKYSYKIKGDFIEIHTEGNYVNFLGKPQYEIKLIYNKETFYIDMKNNKEFNSLSFYEGGAKLKYFFKPEKYIKLLSKTWIPRIEKIKKKYPDDVEYEYYCEDCCSTNVYLHSFRFEYKMDLNNLSFLLENEAYYRDYCYQDTCSLELEIHYPIEKVKPLFKKNFNLSEYNKLDALSKMVFYKKNLEVKSKEIKLISGKIDGKYSFLMALDITDKNNIKGYYLYTSNHKLIELKGHLEDNKIIKTMKIQEYSNHKLTGNFTLLYENKFEDEYDIVGFGWSPPGGKTYSIEINDFENY